MMEEEEEEAVETEDCDPVTESRGNLLLSVFFCSFRFSRVFVEMQFSNCAVSISVLSNFNTGHELLFISGCYGRSERVGQKVSTEK